MPYSRIEDIKRDTDILEIVRSYGIKPNRKGFIVCPFHSDKNGSLKLYKDNTFHCFGCHAHGSVIDFVMKMDGCDFKTAFHKLGGEDRTLTREERQQYARERAEREYRVAVREQIKKKIRNVERVQCALIRYIFHVADGLDHLTEDLWEKVQLCEIGAIKCEIRLSELKEKLNETY